MLHGTFTGWAHCFEFCSDCWFGDRKCIWSVITCASHPGDSFSVPRREKRETSKPNFTWKTVRVDDGVAGKIELFAEKKIVERDVIFVVAWCNFI